MRQKETAWWLQWDRIVLFLFVIGTGLLSALNAQRILGILMVLALGLLMITRTRQQTISVKNVPPELICYSLWVIWAGITGPFVAANNEIFWLDYRVIVQMCVMIWTIYGLLRFKLTPQVVFVGVLCVGVIQMVAAVAGISQVGDLTQANERVMGLTTNSNFLGFLVTIGAVSATVLWHEHFVFGGLRKLFLFSFILSCGYISAISASRKSLIIFSVFFTIWCVLVLPRGRGIKVFASRIFAVILVATVVYVSIPLVMEKTAFGTRWNELTKEGRYGVGEGVRENIRFEMYMAGLQMFANHPITGVGLGQFKVHFQTGAYSHSDIIEPLSTTGALGFILYESFYIILLIRLRRIFLLLRDPTEQYRVKALMMLVVVILLFGLGGPHITAQPVFVLLATLSAYSWTKLHELRAEASAAIGSLHRPNPRIARLGLRSSW